MYIFLQNGNEYYGRLYHWFTVIHSLPTFAVLPGTTVFGLGHVAHFCQFDMNICDFSHI